MTIAYKVGLTPQSEQRIREWRDKPQRVLDSLGRGVDQALAETEAHIQINKLSGNPVNVRSDSLRSQLTHKRDRPLSGLLGWMQGSATKYAKTIAGSGTTTITPRNARWLWIPLPHNQTPSGETRMSPREAFEQQGPKGGRLLSIFRSKKGNMVATLPGTVVPGVRRKSRVVMFVLKKQVTIQGTDALGEGVREMKPRIGEILQAKLMEGLSG